MKVTFNKSWQCFLLFFVLHTLALSIIFLLNISWLFKSVMVLFCLFNLIYVLKKHAWHFSANAILNVGFDTDGTWHLSQRCGNQLDVNLLGTSTVTRFVTVLNFSSKFSRRIISILIFPDMLTKDDYRKLRIAIYKTSEQMSSLKSEI